MRRPPGGRIPPRPDRSRPSLSLRLGASTGGPPTCGPDRLLGPCYKTGRQGSRQSPADPGRRDEIDTGKERPGARPRRRHRVRLRRAGLTGLPGDHGPTGSRPGGFDPGAGAARRPFLGRSAGAKRPGYRLSGRAPRRGPGMVGGTPPGRPLPATQPVAGAAPGRSARGRAPRRPRAPPPSRACGDPRGTAPTALNLPGPICAALPFASRRLHVLLNSLFRVLFNFPSRYLCSIGLVQGI